jgi:hypothetical protein
MANRYSSVACLGALLIPLAIVLYPHRIPAQEYNAAFMRGTVTDPSGAVIPGAKVTATDTQTGVSTSVTTDDGGRYIFHQLMPAPYTISVSAQGFKTLVRPNVVLRVGQQTGLDFKLEVGSTTQTVSVKGAAPLLNTESGALSTVISNEYIMNLPVDMNNLIYLTPGVTEVSGGSIEDTGGTNFVSNGQRYATATFRIDGTLATHPEGGEGSTTIMDYEPAIEDVQEFSVQNNSFSAEYGNNGGTVVDFVTKSGTNQFHGIGWYYMGRPGFDAQNFFSNMAGIPRASFAFDEYGGSFGGPIKKDKTFFFFDLQGQRNNSPLNNVTSVPTMAQRSGDFSRTFNPDGTLDQIFNPCPTVASGNAVPCALTPYSSSGSTDYLRQPFPNNMIPAQDIDPVMQRVIDLYPLPNVPGDPLTGFNNYSYQVVDRSPEYQGDVKIDENFSARQHLMFKYAQSNLYYSQPDPFLGAYKSPIFTHDVSLEDQWMLGPSTLWVNRLGVTRYFENQHVLRPVDPLSLGFPKQLILNPSMDEDNFPFIQPSNYQSLVADSGTTNTVEGTTQWDIESKVTKVIGGHNLAFGGQRQIFFDNFFQPSDTSGNLFYGPDVTAQDVFSPGPEQGNSLASMLLGWGDSSYVTVYPAVADLSMATAFYLQDDWKTTRRLTLDLGLRYEWNTPYDERYNREQFSQFSGNSGVTVPQMCDPGFMLQYGVCSWPGKELIGTTQFATAGHRHANPQYTDFAPRLGFAYQVTPNTVVRAGAGVYYGLNFATNWQYGGGAFNATVPINFSLDGNQTQYATTEIPFPTGWVGPEGRQYGALAMWGEDDSLQHQDNNFEDSIIYQWNFGFERQLSSSTVLEMNYSASRSTHLPWNYTPANRNVMSLANAQKYGSAGLQTQVENPFQYLFTQVPGMPAPIFNLANSIYDFSTIPVSYLLRPYPQFAGGFSGYPPFAANAFYNAVNVSVEKRTSHGLSFMAHYTFSKFMDDSDEGGNASWIGNLSRGEAQDLNDLSLEKSVSANDTPNRFVAGIVYKLPVGRGQAFANHVNRALDVMFGSWTAGSVITLQSGQPILISDSLGRLAVGQQRASIFGDPRSKYSIDQVVNSGGTLNYFNFNVNALECSDPQHGAICDPGDQQLGTAPRYDSAIRAPSIHNVDLSLSKRFAFSESKSLELRADFTNAFNTPRFGFPDSGFTDPTFGVISSQLNMPRQGTVALRFYW